MKIGTCLYLSVLHKHYKFAKYAGSQEEFYVLTLRHLFSQEIQFSALSVWAVGWMDSSQTTQKDIVDPYGEISL